MVRRLISTVALGLLAGSAHAADPLSYSHFDFAYLGSETETEGAEEKLDAAGFRIGAGVGLAKWLNFVGEYDQRRYDEVGDEIAFGSAGFGFHTADPAYQLQLQGTYERMSFDDNAEPSNDDTTEGWGALVGGRFALPSLELHVSAKYIDFGDVDDGTGNEIKTEALRYRGGFLIQLSPWWSFTADYQLTQLSEADVDEDFNEWTAGFRRYFPTDTDRRRRKGGLLAGEETQAQ